MLRLRRPGTIVTSENHAVRFKRKPAVRCGGLPVGGGAVTALPAPLLLARYRALDRLAAEVGGQVAMRAPDHPEFRAHVAEALLGQGYRMTAFEPLDAQSLSVDPALNLRLGRGRPVFLDNPAPSRERPQASGLRGLDLAECGWPALFEGPSPAWALIDPVCWPDALELLRDSAQGALCLYATPDAERQAAAPWLVPLSGRDPVSRALMALPPDRHAGICFQSQAGAMALRAHFRRYTMAWLPGRDAAPLYFRFHDPRVLSDMAQALEPARFAGFASPVQRFFLPLSTELSLAAHLPGGTVGPLDDPATLQGRLLRLAPRGRAVAPGNLHVTEAEFARFDRLKRQRTAQSVARGLYRSLGQDKGPEACLEAAGHAMRLGDLHDMPSRAQVGALARAVLFFGADFAERDSRAAEILEDRRALPFQRKDRLLRWLALALGERGGAALAAPALRTGQG